VIGTLGRFALHKISLVAHNSFAQGGCDKPLHTNTTASITGALRIFPSLLPFLNKSAARSAAAPYDLFSCTISITFKRTYAKHRRMPPKKAVKEEKILLGRPGNNLKSGIVGLANVGKSTLFNAISKVN
jgi:hypothetical protein